MSDEIQLEVVDPERIAALGPHFVRLLRQHAHAHVLEHRQRLGQRDRFAGAIDLESETARRRFQRAIQVQRQAAEREAVEPAHIGHRGARGNILAVRRWKRVAEALEELCGARLALLVVQRLAQIVLPAPRGVGQAPLHFAAVVRTNPARRRAHRHVDTRQHRVGQQNVEVRGCAVERLQQDRLELAPQFGRVVLARHVDQAGDEALERVAPDEEAEALPLAELQDAVGDLVQVVGRDLEQLVARVGLEDVGERLAEVARGRQARALGHVPHLAAQQRNLRNARAVGGRREEAEEAMLADHFTAGSVALHADVVDVARAMDRGTCVRLRHQQQRRRRLRQRARLRRQGHEARRFGGAAGRFAQHAKAGAWNDLQREVAIRTDEVVLPVSQQQQVILRQPLEEVAVLADLLARQRWRLAVDLADHRAQLRHHRLPVDDGGAHVAEHALDALRELRAGHGVGEPVDLDVHEGLARGVRLLFPREQSLQRASGIALDGEDRMHDQVQRQALPVDLHRRRIDEEGHVVVDDLDHRVARRPAMLAGGRVQHADLRLVRLAALGELPVRQQRAIEVLDVTRRDVLRIDPLEVARRESQEAAPLSMLNALLDQRRYGGQAGRLVRFRGTRHGVSPILFAGRSPREQRRACRRQVCPARAMAIACSDQSPGR